MVGNPNGSIVLNGITDAEMGRIWEVKARNEKSLIFLANQMQPTQTPQGQPFYNNVVFQWSGDPGLQIVHEILTFLLKKEERAAASNQ